MNTDTYDKATLLSAAIEPNTLDLLTFDTRASYIGACRDSAAEIGELLDQLASSKPATAAA